LLAVWSWLRDFSTRSPFSAGVVFGLAFAVVVPCILGAMTGQGWSKFGELVAGTAAGGLISAILSMYFAHQGGTQLKAEADRLRQHVNAVLAVLPVPPNQRLDRDKKGDPIVHAFASGQPPILVIVAPPGSAAVGPPGPAPTYDRQHEQPEPDVDPSAGTASDQG
jgi:hypothetical protein